jgi:hypothetical protein
MKIKLGDILVSTYGYDAGLANFYKVVARTAKTVKICRLHDIVHTGNWVDGTAAPKPDSRMGDMLTKKIHVGHNGYEYLDTDLGMASLWDGKPVNTYNHH